MAKNKIVAFDMDGTILHYERGMHLGSKEEFGLPIVGVAHEMRKLKADGWKIVIWTCRNDSPELRAHLDACAIPYDEVNANVDEDHGSPKVMADVYVDDRGLRFNGRASGLAEKVKSAKTPWWDDAKAS